MFYFGVWHLAAERKKILHADTGIHYKYFKSVSQPPFISPLKTAFICTEDLTLELDVSVGLTVRKHLQVSTP